jgi:hypothetical protein
MHSKISVGTCYVLGTVLGSVAVAVKNKTQLSSRTLYFIGGRQEINKVMWCQVMINEMDKTK